MKDAICKAFCEDLSIRSVPAGLAVGTSFGGVGGDPVGFYILGPDADGKFRIEDSGTTVATIEASGADLENESRLEAFRGLLRSHAASYDEDHGELFVSGLSEDAVPHAALKFVALLLRMQDMLLMARERAANTFREDALKSIREGIKDAEITEQVAIAAEMSDFPADVVIRRARAVPIAVFLATTNQRVLEAVLMQTVAIYERQIPCSVVALLENDDFLAARTRQQAANRLAAMPIFRGDEQQAVRQIANQARMIQ